MYTNQNNYLIKSASYLSVITALVILVTKFYGWFITDSQSMLASLIDSTLDISCSLINLVVITIAFRPPDNNHRFGHEKFQDLAIFSQSMFFFSSGVFTMFSSIRSTFYRPELINYESGLDVMYLCIILTLCLVCYQAYVIKITGSELIKADRMHYFSDLLTNFAVVISLKLSTNYWMIDSVAGIAISIYILYSSYSLLKVAIGKLVDEEFDSKDREKILFIVSKYPQVRGVHELKTRFAASKSFIQFHLELDGAMSLFDAHEISDEICEELSLEFPKGEIIIHQDPAGLEASVNYPEKLGLREVR
ncbi:MAG: cation diffusion facilitator family transporter [Janthinobacterium lividum]